MVAAILNLLIGLVLFFLPSLFDMSEALSENVFIVAPLTIAFSIISMWEVNRSVRFFNVVTGAWLAASVFVLPTQFLLPRVVCGLAGVCIFLLALIPSKTKQNYGGGWMSLFQKHPPHDSATHQQE